MAPRHPVGHTGLGPGPSRRGGSAPDAAQVADVLAACHDARVPVTAVAGRSGVCGSSIPLFGGVALDLCGLAGLVDVDTTSLLADVLPGTFGPDLESELRRPRRHPRALAAIDGPVDGGRMGGVPGRRPVLHPLREDRGHGHRAGGGPGRRPRHQDRGRGPTCRARPRPFAALHRVRRGLGGDHRSAVPSPSRGRRPGSTGLWVAGVRRRARGVSPYPATRRHAGGPPSLRPHRVGSELRARRPECARGPRRSRRGPRVGDTGVVDAECATGEARKLDESIVERWLGHRNDVSALAPLYRAGIVVDTIEIAARWSALPLLYDACVSALLGIEGTLAASAHQSHAYVDGACLYFTFAGPHARPIVNRGRASVAVSDADADAWAELYYTSAWRRGHGHRAGPGGALSHHHGVGHQPRALHGRRAGRGLRRAGRAQGERWTPGASSTRASSGCRRPSARSRWP